MYGITIIENVANVTDPFFSTSAYHKKDKNTHDCILYT